MSDKNKRNLKMEEKEKEIEIRIKKDFREKSQKFIIQIVRIEDGIAKNYILYHEVVDGIRFSCDVFEVRDEKLT